MSVPKDIVLEDLMREVLTAWRVAAVGVAVGAAGFVSMALVRPAAFTASAVIQPESGPSVNAGLSGLAATLGVAVPSFGQGDSPAFIVSVVGSRAVALSAVEVLEEAKGERVIFDSLLVYYGIDEQDRTVQREKLVRAIGRDLRVRADASTSTVSLEFASRDSVVSSLVVRAYLSSTVEKLRELRQRQAADQRSALAPVVEEARQDLSAAESRLAAFQSRNRQPVLSPEQSLELQRIRREVDQRAEIFVALARALAEAEVASAKRVSALRVIEEPWVSPLPDSRKLLLRFVSGGLSGLVVAAFLVLGSNRLKPYSGLSRRQ